MKGSLPAQPAERGEVYDTNMKRMHAAGLPQHFCSFFAGVRFGSGDFPKSAHAVWTESCLA